MTREEFVDWFKREYGLTDEQMSFLGLYAVPCWCRGELPGCTGWQMELGDAGNLPC